MKKRRRWENQILRKKDPSDKTSNPDRKKYENDFKDSNNFIQTKNYVGMIFRAERNLLQILIYFVQIKNLCWFILQMNFGNLYYIILKLLNKIIS